MIGGLDRYFQIATCFRDEDLRSDRQPEFTQIDLEMSFETEECLFAIVEGLLQLIFKECLAIDIRTPFPRMAYPVAMERFGTDRPDMRFKMELTDITSIVKRSSFSVFREEIEAGGIVKGLCVKGGSDLSRKAIDDYTAFVGQFGIRGLAWMKMEEKGLASSIVKFFPEDVLEELSAIMEIQPGDLIFMIADRPAAANQALDHLRRKIAQDRGLIPPNVYEFLWVTDFPLFHWSAEEKRFESEHHPFTCPHPEDLPYLTKDPARVRALAYDIVVNGSEIGGGSQRIHDPGLQRKIFEILQLSASDIAAKFGFFLDALSYGAPPHLGLAFGLDRILMILANTESIRDVIAFPKTQKGSDLMLECPSPVSQKQLNELHIRMKNP